MGDENGIDDELQERANDFARRLKYKIPRLERDMEELEKKKAEISAEIESARRSEELASQYLVYVNGGSQRCPLCWVNKGSTVIIDAIDGNGNVDRFRCSECRSEFVGRA